MFMILKFNFQRAVLLSSFYIFRNALIWFLKATTVKENKHKMVMFLHCYSWWPSANICRFYLWIAGWADLKVLTIDCLNVGGFFLFMFMFYIYSFFLFMLLRPILRAPL